MPYKSHFVVAFGVQLTTQLAQVVCISTHTLGQQLDALADEDQTTRSLLT
eukprot:m.29683 g.29683  ORF g.29683 m.29683 type:complete len:50 (+) comp10542_c1_seq1:1701-1850(+)